MARNRNSNNYNRSSTSGLGDIIFQIGKLVFGQGRINRQIRKDVSTFTTITAEIAPILVPLDINEVNLLSYSSEYKSRGRGNSRHHIGYLKSIYNEDLFVVARKDYDKWDKELTVVKSESKEYIFLREGDSTRVLLDGNNYGTILNNGALYLDRNRRAIYGRISELSSHTPSIVIEDKKVAAIKPEDKSTDVPNRLFYMIDEENIRNWDALVILVLYRLLEQYEPQSSFF